MSNIKITSTLKEEEKEEKEEKLPLFFPEHLFKSKIVPKIVPKTNSVLQSKSVLRFNMSILPRQIVRQTNQVVTINNEQKRSIRMGF